MEWLIIWLLFGIITAVVASKKGRDGCGWFILGVLLGPFGFVLALVISEDKQAVERRFISTEYMKKCPYCAEIIKAEAIICRYCGKDQQETENIPVEKSYELSIDEQNRVRCPLCSCGKRLTMMDLHLSNFTCSSCNKTIQFTQSVN